MDLTTGEGKLRALNFSDALLQKIPNRLLRSEWATRISQQLRIDEPVLRAALSKAAAERRSEVKTQPELVGKSAKPIERRLIRMLMEAEGFRRELAQRLQQGGLYQGWKRKKSLPLSSWPPLRSAMQATGNRGAAGGIATAGCCSRYSSSPPGRHLEEAESCLEALRRRLIEQELAEVHGVSSQRGRAGLARTADTRNRN